MVAQQENTATDPLLDGWHNEVTNEELADECRNHFDSGSLSGSSAANEETDAGSLSNQTFGGTGYYLNNIFNLSAVRSGIGAACDGGVNLRPLFTAPDDVNAGDVVDFDGMESDVNLSDGTAFKVNGEGKVETAPTEAKFTWNFGDPEDPGNEVSGYAPGAPSEETPSGPLCEAGWLSPCAASESHVYRYKGTYTVTLTIEDLAGNIGEVARTVTVVGGPERPSPPPSPTAPVTSTSTTSAASAGAGHSSTPGAVPPPAAAAEVLTRTLRALVKNGVVVRYSVNEQVAGRFEVLLARSLARRLGISGALATGLPSGTPPELVIAKAIVVTTTGGRSKVDIVLPKRTARRLAREHDVSLMLMLVVRSAGHTPTSTTVLSAFTLGR